MSHRDTNPSPPPRRRCKWKKWRTRAHLVSSSPFPPFTARFTRNLINSGKFWKLGKDYFARWARMEKSIGIVVDNRNGFRSRFLPSRGNMVIYVRGQLHQVTRSWPGRATVDTRHSNHDKLTWPEPLQSQRGGIPPFRFEDRSSGRVSRAN